MTRDRSDAVCVEWTGIKTRRRLRFEPRDAGGWERIEERKTADGWQPVGWEIVNDVVLDQGGEVVA